VAITWRMDEKPQDELEPEELEEQDAEELPDREAMSVITPEVLEGDVFPLKGDPGDEW
jgi:hypothetical protein